MFYRAWFLYRGQNDMSRVVGAVDRLDRSVTALSPVVVTAFGIFSLYYVAFSYGLFVIALAGGKRGHYQCGSQQWQQSWGFPHLPPPHTSRPGVFGGCRLGRKRPGILESQSISIVV